MDVGGRAKQDARAEQLSGIEKRCFQTDLISRRQWRYLLTRPHADILLPEDDNRVNG